VDAQCSRGHSGRRRVCALLSTAAAVAVLLGASAAVLAACGGGSGGAVAAPSPPAPSPPVSPGSTPLTGTPKEAVKTFWRLMDADAYEALAAATAPGSPTRITAEADDIESVALLHVGRVERQPGSALVQVDVRVVPASDITPWGEPGRHTLFVRLIRQAPGEWLVSGWGTSP
jgi:hypothetical protein